MSLSPSPLINVVWLEKDVHTLSSESPIWFIHMETTIRGEAGIKLTMLIFNAITKEVFKLFQPHWSMIVNEHSHIFHEITRLPHVLRVKHSSRLITLLAKVAAT